MLNPNPDLFFTFGRQGQTPFYSHSTYIPDAVPGQNYTFDNLNIEMSDAFGIYELSLWDFDDTTDDDLMGGMVFIPFTLGNGFPGVFNDDTGGVVAFTMLFRFVFD